MHVVRTAKNDMNLRHWVPDESCDMSMMKLYNGVFTCYHFVLHVKCVYPASQLSKVPAVTLHNTL